MNAKTVFSRFWLLGYAMLTPPPRAAAVLFTQLLVEDYVGVSPSHGRH